MPSLWILAFVVGIVTGTATFLGRYFLVAQAARGVSLVMLASAAQ